MTRLTGCGRTWFERSKLRCRRTKKLKHIQAFSERLGNRGMTCEKCLPIWSFTRFQSMQKLFYRAREPGVVTGRSVIAPPIKRQWHTGGFASIERHHERSPS
jgi:hypothetical protein